MRATISFETDVDQVEGTMAVLACSEEHNLRAAADFLSNFTVLDGSTLGVITEVLRLLDMSTDQLRQYQNMLVSFERARFETMLPQDAPLHSATETTPEPDTPASVGDLVRNMREVQSAVEAMGSFNNFLDRIEDPEEEEPTADEES
jgi:hypothetical protein